MAAPRPSGAQPQGIITLSVKEKAEKTHMDTNVTKVSRAEAERHTGERVSTVTETRENS